MKQISPAAGLVLAGAVLVFAFSALYVAAYHAPRPHGLDVGVVGSQVRAARVQTALDAQAPGGFDVRRYAGEPAARDALLDTDVRGVLTGDEVLVAGAFGPAPTQAVSEALRAAGRARVVHDLRPLPPADRRGLASLFTVVGTLLPSVAFGVLLASRALSARVRWAAILAYSSLAGVVVAFNDDVLVGALEGHFAGVAVVAGLLALAVSSAAHGLTRLGGPAGTATAVLLLTLLGLSASGGAVTYQLQPGFYGAISQLLPPGAALTAVRNVQYFDWSATTAPLLVLGAWAAGGLAAARIGFATRGREGTA
jgi:hypothetical protein